MYSEHLQMPSQSPLSLSPLSPNWILGAAFKLISRNIICPYALFSHCKKSNPIKDGSCHSAQSPSMASHLQIKTYRGSGGRLKRKRIHIFIYKIMTDSEKAIAPHSSPLAWKIPWTEEPCRLQSMGSLESDMIEQLHFRFSLSCIGERNGNWL